MGSLTTRELLQVVIGSGNSYIGVSKIARRTLKVLGKYGSGVSFEQLMGVPGLGPARVCQIVALFELAGRYPSTAKQLTIDTPEKIISSLAPVRDSAKETLVLLTLDGGYGQIAKRTFLVGDKHPSELMRQIFIEIVRDRAAKIVIGIGSSDRSLEPALFDLSLARELRVMAGLFHVTVRGVYIINHRAERSLRVLV